MQKGIAMAHYNKNSGIHDNADLLAGTAKRIHDEIISRADGYLEGTYDPKASARKTLLKGTTTALVVLSLLTGLAFSGPADITQEQAGTQFDRAPVVMDIDEYANAQVDDDDDDADEQKGARSGLIARFRQAVLSLPSAVRLLVVVPLWAIGTALMTLVSFLWNVIFASPLGAFIASFAVGFAVLTVLFAATAKILFPDVPLRRILCKRNILILGVSAIALAGLDAAMPLFWHQYPAVSALVKLAAGAAVVGILSVRTKSLFRRERYRQMPPAAA